ncbi:MAG: DUF11 domain-containing protein [Clostridiales bacterium]|nr:DUF11 domain-containing protein [Clostridiales bacterium]
MKKTLKGFLAVLLLLSLLPTVGLMATSDNDFSEGQLNPQLPGSTTNYVVHTHSYGDWQTETEPTCTREGLKVRVCNCGDRQTESIPAKGHSWGEWTVTKAATCKETGTKTRTCTACGATETETIAKTTEHSYGDWVVTKAATCKETGTRTWTCSVCGDTKTETIAKTEHSYGDWVVTKAANCKETGTRTRICSVCGDTKTETIAKTEHNWSAWKVTKEPTCVESGTRTQTCSICGDTKTESIAMTEHQYGAWKVTREPTCVRKGVQERKCSVCGNVQTKQLKKTDHTPGEWTVTKEPDCHHKGKRTTKCTVCGKKLSETLPKTTHVFEEWEIEVPETDHSMGKRSAKCTICGEKKTEKFYPEGTLYRGGDNPPEEVKKLQSTLHSMGLYKGKISGEFDKATAEAVKKLEKELGIGGDGIAWPLVLKSLGLFGKPGEPVSSDLKGHSLVLTAVQTSPVKDYYSAGDQITYKWTLTNVSKKQDAMSVRTYSFKGLKPDKKKDLEIGQPETLIPGESFSDEYVYTVTKDDALAGQFTIGFIGRCKFGKKAAESNTVLFVNHTSAGTGGSGGAWTPPAEELLGITKTVDNTPENGFFFVKGETIQYMIAIENKTSSDVTGVILTDNMFADMNGDIGTIKAGDIKFFSAPYTVQAKDVPAGEVINTAVVSYTGTDGKLKTGKATAKAPVGMVTGGLYVWKTAVSTPKNSLFYQAGEKVTFEITVANPIKKTFTNVKLYDKLSPTPNDPIKVIGKMKAGDKVTVTFTHTVTKLEAKLGKVTNTARVGFTDPDQKKRLSVSNVCTVPAGLEFADGVTVVKTVINTPENGKYFEDGEEIRFQIDVTNNTVKDITDMEIRDSLAEIDLNGFRTIAKGETLAAGQTATYHFSFPVGPADVEDTKVTNVASAWWTVDAVDYTETFSEPVTVPTAEVLKERKAEPVNLDGAACENALTAVGEGVAVHDVTECSEHEKTAADSADLVAQSDYEQARSLWDEDVDELYGEWMDHTDAEGKRNAEDEKAAWEYQLGALEASVSLICGSDEVQAIAVEERMNKCVGLCYELHSAPETRSDSLSGEHVSMPQAKESTVCVHTAVYSENGSARVEDDQCESHMLTMQLTEHLLEIASDDEEITNAWLRAQGNWLLELNTMYDAWYLSASDESQRAKIADDRISFDRLIEARRKTLADLYPDDPATAAEVLANMIMNRTETICRLLHHAGILTD